MIRIIIIIVVIILLLILGLYFLRNVLLGIATERLLDRFAHESPFVRGVLLEEARFITPETVSLDGADVYLRYPDSKPIRLDSILIKGLWSGFAAGKWIGECTGGGIVFPITARLEKIYGQRSLTLSISSPWFDVAKFANHFVKPIRPYLRTLDYKGRARFSFNVNTNFFQPPAAWLELELDGVKIHSRDFVLAGCTASLIVPFSGSALDFIDTSKKGKISIENIFYHPYNVARVSAEICYGRTDYKFDKISFSCYEGALEGDVKIIPKNDRWVHQGSARVKDISLGLLVMDVGKVLEGSTGIIEGSFQWEGEGTNILYAAGDFAVKKPGGKLQAKFLRSLLGYMPDTRLHDEIDRSVGEDKFFYFVEGKLGFKIDESINRCEIKLDIEGKTLHLKLTVEMTLDDFKALFRLRKHVTSKLVSSGRVVGARAAS